MSPVRCPVCARQFEPHQSPAMPFCSQRCRQIDLHRWLGEKYAIPDARSPDEAAAEDRPPEAEEAD